MACQCRFKTSTLVFVNTSFMRFAPGLEFRRGENMHGHEFRSVGRACWRKFLICQAAIRVAFEKKKAGAPFEAPAV
jgi:hypothetical protein